MKYKIDQTSVKESKSFITALNDIYGVEWAKYRLFYNDSDDTRIGIVFRLNDATNYEKLENLILKFKEGNTQWELSIVEYSKKGNILLKPKLPGRVSKKKLQEILKDFDLLTDYLIRNSKLVKQNFEQND